MDNPYIDESKLLHHVAILTRDEVFGIYYWSALDKMSYLCDKARCHPQQVYRISWSELPDGYFEYILDVDPTRIIHEG